MKASIIQALLALGGIFFAIADQTSVAAAFVVGGFVVWALRRDEP